MKALLAVAACVAVATVAAAQDQLNAAKDLYASAAYEEALTTLTRLHEGAGGGGASEQVEQYRAFCLFALGRTAEAQAVAEGLVTVSPLLEIDSADASPRIVAMFNDVRKRMLPGLIREQYRSGRSAIDRKEFAAARSQFAKVRQMLDEAEKVGVKDDTLADLRVLVEGFSELAENAVARQAPATPAPPSAPPSPANSDSAASSSPAAPKIYAVGMEGVVGPVVVRQDVPQLPRELVAMLSGSAKTTILDIIIDEKGDVERAAVRQSAIRMYDSLLINAAKTWKYRPATKGDRPVKYLKTLEIVIKPAGDTPLLQP